MARKNTKGKSATYRVFNVTYVDGMMTSNRRVAVALLDQTFGDDLLDLARTAIQQQDSDIAQRSNQRRAKIKTIVEA